MGCSAMHGKIPVCFGLAGVISRPDQLHWPQPLSRRRSCSSGLEAAFMRVGDGLGHCAPGSVAFPPGCRRTPLTHPSLGSNSSPAASVFAVAARLAADVRSSTIHPRRRPSLAACSAGSCAARGSPLDRGQNRSIEAKRMRWRCPFHAGQRYSSMIFKSNRKGRMVMIFVRLCA